MDNKTWVRRVFEPLSGCTAVGRKRPQCYGLYFMWIAILGYTGIFFFLQKRLYDGLHMEIWDLGIFNQALHNSLQGRFLQYSIPGGTAHLFYERVQAIIVLLLPLYAISPRVESLFLIQSLGVAVGAWAIYLIAGHFSEDDLLSACLGLAYLLYPSIQGMTLNMFLYGFHPENLAPAFLLFAVYFVLKGKQWPAYALSVLTMSCGEYLSLTVGAFGIYVVLVCQKKWKMGVTLILVSAAWMLVSMLVIVPLFRGEYPWYLSRVAERPPSVSVKQVTDLVYSYIQYLLLPVLFTPFLSPVTVLLAIPGLLLNFLACFFGYKGYSPFSWHMAPVAPFVFLSATIGLSKLARKLKHSGRSPLVLRFLLVAILGAGVASSFWLSPMPWSHAVATGQYADLSPEREEILKRLSDLIGPEDSVSADIFWGSHFTSREIIHLFPYGGWRDHDWVLIDTRSKFMEPWIKEQIDLVRASPDHQLVFAEDGVELYRHRPRELPPIQNSKSVLFSNHVRLLGYNLNRTRFKAGSELVLDLFWTADGTIDKSYTVFVHVLSSDGRIAAQSDAIPVSSSYPTSAWPIGRIIWDTHRIRLSEEVLPGSYEIKTGLYYWEDGRRANVLDENGNPVETFVSLGSLSIVEE